MWRRLSPACAWLYGSMLSLPAQAGDNMHCPAGEPRAWLLQVEVNGATLARDQRLLRDRCGRWYWPQRDAHALPLAHGAVPAPQTLADGQPYLPLDAIASQIELDDALQQLRLSVPAERLTPHTLALPATAPGEPSPVNLNGAYLDYELLATSGHGDSRPSWGASVFARAFGPWGGLQQSGVIRQDGSAASRRTQTLRLETSYLYEHAAGMWTLRLGDSVSQSFGSAQPVRFAGVQLARDFSLQPGFLPYPQQTISGSAALPSALEVYVNDTLNYAAKLPPGPFELSQLPAVSHDGDVRLQLRDPLGRVTQIETPLLSLTQLLAPGQWDFAVQAGRERLDYGYAGNRYGAGFASGGFRVGVSPWLTLDARAEATRGGLLGLGLIGRLGRLGTLTLNGAYSRTPDVGEGGQALLGYQWRGRRLSAGVQTVRRQSAFRQLGMAPDAEQAPTRSDNGYVGTHWGRLGLSLAYSQRCTPSSPCLRSRSTSANLPLPMRSVLNLSVLETRDPTRRRGVFVSLTLPLGQRSSLYASLSRQDDQLGRTLGYQYADEAPLPRSANLTVQQDADTTRLLAAARADTRYQSLQLELDHRSRDGTQLRASAQGSLIVTAPFIGASRQVGDGFALVSTGGQPGIPVSLENRTVATSDANGLALIPRLYGYVPNRIGIDPSQLGIDYRVADTQQTLRPQRGSGYRVDFALTRPAPGRIVALTLPPGWQLGADSEVWRGAQRWPSVVMAAQRLYLDAAERGDYLLRLAPARQCRFSLSASQLAAPMNSPLGPLTCTLAGASA